MPLGLAFTWKVLFVQACARRLALVAARTAASMAGPMQAAGAASAWAAGAAPASDVRPAAIYSRECGEHLDQGRLLKLGAVS